ncbi:MAG: 3-hydroxyacyl-CoA dehydrogenase NAD-binding domain-containing protein [Chloroflexota bacterium]|nr:3-hydroxyacyl-CoA dehydrogenase NAD-binding domain-containing protein [Chloroflexota bacterium]
MAKEVVGIVGVGAMGAGIAQVALENGHEVVIHDVDDEAIERGRARIRDGLSRRAAKLELDADSIDDWVGGRIKDLRDAETIALLGAEVDVAIEAAIEDLELKRDIFRALDAAADPDAILATNTSALSVAAIAEVTRFPQRVLGLHFFNPAPLMSLVEVVAGPATDPATADRAAELVERWGKEAVRCADTPGFIVNRVNRPFTIEALRMLEAGEASIEGVDGAMRAAGYPMGPFELMDHVGLDVNLAAARGVWEGLGRPDRLRPSPIQERLVEAGRLGRKTGEGFYRWRDGRRDEPADEFTALPADSLGANEIADRIGLFVVNEAWHALGDGVATADDIDLALRLGAAHPMGPFERTESMGGKASVADALRRMAVGTPRFEPAPNLRAR